MDKNTNSIVTEDLSFVVFLFGQTWCVILSTVLFSVFLNKFYQESHGVLQIIKEMAEAGPALSAKEQSSINPVIQVPKSDWMQMTDQEPQNMFSKADIHVFPAGGLENTYPLPHIQDWSEYGGLGTTIFSSHTPSGQW